MQTIAAACTWNLGQAKQWKWNPPGPLLHLQEDHSSCGRQKGNTLNLTPPLDGFHGSPNGSVEWGEGGFLKNLWTSITSHWQPAVGEGHCVCELGPSLRVIPPIRLESVADDTLPSQPRPPLFGYDSRPSVRTQPFHNVSIALWLIRRRTTLLRAPSWRC